MENAQKSSLTRIIRALHRDIGFFTIGLVVIYAISGILLIYRDTGLLKTTKQIDKIVPKNIPAQGLSRMLHKEVRVIKNEGDLVIFQGGTYNKATGQLKYSSEEVIAPFDKFIELHKSASNNAGHIFLTIFGVVLLFMALSSFWMYHSGSPKLRRGLYFAGGGVVFTIALMMIL